MEEKEILTREEQRERLKRETRYLEENSKTPSYILQEQEELKAKRISRLVLAAVAAAFLLAAVCYYNNYEFMTYSVDGQMSAGAPDSTKVYSFGDGAAVIGPDAVSYMKGGKTVWSEAFSMRSPRAAVSRDYFAIYDENGYTLNICDRTGILCSIRLTRQILGADISESGITAVFTASEEAAYISYFDRFGGRVPVEIKSVLSATGCPVDFAVSPDGQKLSVISYSVSGGESVSRVNFYDFERGRKDTNYITGVLEKPEDPELFLLETFFFDDTHAACIGEKEIEFLSYTEKHELKTQETVFEDSVRSVLHRGKYLCVIYEGDNGLYAVLYEADGSVYSRFDIREDYGHVTMNDQFLFFYNGADVRLYNFSGNCRYAGTLTDTLVSAAFSGSKSLTFNNGKVIEQITLK